MLHILMDTCVWLDLAKDRHGQTIVDTLNTLISSQEIELIVPQVSIDEFDRNRNRVIEASRRGLQPSFRIVREAAKKYGAPESREKTLQALDELQHHIDLTTDHINDTAMQIDTLLRSKPNVPTSDSVKKRVAERAILKLAPYHRGRNSVGDAILIEIYSDTVLNASDMNSEFAFVTHNTKDFSAANADRRIPHGDLLPLFQSERSTYWTSISDLIRERFPDSFEEDEDEHFYVSQQSRSLSEILEAEHLISLQVWYDRHSMRRSSIEKGRIQVVSEEEYHRDPYSANQILDTIWAGATEAAKKTEDELGLDNLGPWNDFEWGMLNGKLSALRWITGEEWDMLDT